MYYVVNRFKELGTSEDCPRSASPRTARSKKVVKAVQKGKGGTRRNLQDMNFGQRHECERGLNENIPSKTISNCLLTRSEVEIIAHFLKSTRGLKEQILFF